jgi:hypothetical protein
VYVQMVLYPAAELCDRRVLRGGALSMESVYSSVHIVKQLSRIILTVKDLRVTLTLLMLPNIVQSFVEKA